MEAFIAWCGFVGAWLLVAGSVYQAAIELSDQQAERADVARVAGDLVQRNATDRPPPVSAWWWLVPPVLYVKQRRRSAETQKRLLSQLTPEQTVVVVDYLNKATGWMLVGLGGLLIAAKETWGLREHYDWPVWTFWVLAVVAVAVCLTNAGRRMHRSQTMVDERRQQG